MMYGVGALVAAADGVPRKNTAVLRHLAKFLDISDPTKKTIERLLRQATSTQAALSDLLAVHHPIRDKAAHIRVLAKDGIFSLPMLNSTEVSQLLGSRSQNQRQYAAALRRRGALLGLQQGNRYLYPKFQIDPKTRQVYPTIEVVSQILNASGDPWATVSWWTSPNPRLMDRQPPMQLLGTPNAGTDLPALARAMVEVAG